MANLTFDERKCVHSVNEDRPNEYRDLLQAISKSFKLISPSSLFYGFGANSVTKVTEVSDLFVGTSRIEPSGEVCKADRESNRLCRAITGAFSKG